MLRIGIVLSGMMHLCLALTTCYGLPAVDLAGLAAWGWWLLMALFAFLAGLFLWFLISVSAIATAGAGTLAAAAVAVLSVVVLTDPAFRPVQPSAERPFRASPPAMTVAMVSAPPADTVTSSPPRQPEPDARPDRAKQADSIASDVKAASHQDGKAASHQGGDGGTAFQTASGGAFHPAPLSVDSKVNTAGGKALPERSDPDWTVRLPPETVVSRDAKETEGRLQARDSVTTASANGPSEDGGDLVSPRVADRDTAVQPQERPAHEGGNAVDIRGARGTASVTRIFADLARSLPRIAAVRETLAGRPSAGVKPFLASIDARMARLAAEGHTHAQFSQAEALLTGPEREENEAQARALLERAALGGYVPAQVMLATLAAEHPDLLRRDMAEAHAWLSAAASQGSVAAMRARDALSGGFGPEEMSRAERRERKLAELLALLQPERIREGGARELDENLRSAATLGDLEAVHVLLAEDADPEAADKDGRTPLIEAAWRGYPGIVEALLYAGARPGTPDATGKTPLIWAAINGHAGVIAKLIREGSPVDAQDEDGFTALMRAAWNGHAAAVTALLEGGADKRIVNREGLRALDYARRERHTEVSQLLGDRSPVQRASIQTSTRPLLR